MTPGLVLSLVTNPPRIWNFPQDNLLVSFLSNPGNVLCHGLNQRQEIQIFQMVRPRNFLTEEVRKEMYKQSISLAKKVKYHSAGTIEYIMDKDRNFYFLEMNSEGNIPFVL